MSATIKGPYNYISGSGISVGVVLNASTGEFDVTVTNTSPSSGGTLTASSVTGTGFWYSAGGSLNGAAVGFSGDATIGALSGGNVPITLATVNANVGSFGDGTHVGSFTVNAKGLITAASSVAISFPTMASVVSGAGITVTGGPAYMVAVAAATAHAVMLTTGSAGFTTTAPGATTGVPLVSNGTSADPTFGTASVGGGGTGITSAGAANNVLVSTGSVWKSAPWPGPAVAPASSSSSVSLTGTTPAVMGTVTVTTPNDGVTRNVVLIGNVNITNTNPTTSWTATFGFSINSTVSYTFFDSFFLSSGGTLGFGTGGINQTVTQAPNTTTIYRWMANLSSGASGVTSNGYMTAIVF